MDIKSMDENVYNNIFEIDNIKRAFFIYIKLHSKVKKCNNIDISDRRKIVRYTLGFKSICKKLIQRDNIFVFEDYKLSVQSLVLINAKIQEILNDNKYCNINEVLKIEEDYNRINKYLSYSNSSFDIFLENHFTFFILFLMFGLVAYVLINFFITKNIIGIIIVIFLTFILMLTLLIFNKRLTKNFYIDRIKRTINKNTYVNSLNVKKYNENIKNILSIAGKK